MLRWSVQSAFAPQPPSRRTAPPVAKSARASPSLSSPVAPNPAAYDLSIATRHFSFPDGATLIVAASRAAIAAAANDCLTSARAPATLRTYNSLLDSVIPSAEASLGLRLLPLDSDQKFIALFSHLLVTASSGPGPTNSAGARSVRWSYVRSVRAAITSWHSSRDLPSVLDVWTPRMLDFWVGLKRRAIHHVTNKLPLSIASVKSILLKGDATRGPLAAQNGQFPDLKQHLLVLRSAATVAVAFFGLRRADEVSRTLISHLSVDSSGSVIINVPRQKNDQLGKGQAAVIPTFPSWGGACPTRILLAWRDARAMLTKWDRHARLGSGAGSDAWLFVSLSGPSWGRRLGPDAIREAIRKHCAEGGPLPSPRKGGVRFYRTSGASADIVQVQGGWKSSAVLATIYDGRGEREVLEAINAAARTAEHLLAAEQCLLLWGSLSSQPHDSSALISQLGEILPHLTPSHAIEFGPRARGSIIHALRSWQL